MLTAERLRELLHYDPETGVFTRLVAVGYRGCRKVGSVAGCVKKDGYLYVSVDGVTYLGHRLAFLHVNGQWPPHEVDHINCVRSDNWFANLRAATTSQNQQNRSGLSAHNTSGTTGVSWCKQTRKWLARCEVNGKNKNLGRFDSKADAIEYRELAQAMLHPFSKAAARLPVHRMTP